MPNATAYDRTIAADVRTLILGAGLVNPDTDTAIAIGDVVLDYLPRFEPADLSNLKIVIAPRSRTLTPLSRSSRRREIVIQIGVMMSATPDSALFTGLLDLVAAIDEYLANVNQISTKFYTGQWSESTTTLYDVGALEQHSVFRSVISVTYLLLT
jgi:hypothetical protein